MENFKLIADCISLASNTLTIATSVIAIYVFFFKGKEIKSAFTMLVNWSFQLTLTDLRSKIDRLNEYNASEQTEIDEIRNILHEIAGQIKGNRKLVEFAPKLAERVEKSASNKRLTEPMKRSLVSEIRETLRTIEINAVTSQSE